MADLPHPDAKLIELGRQFEETRAKAIPLDRKHKALFDASEKAIAEAGIPDVFSDRTPEQRQLADQISREAGYAVAYDAFNKAHGKLIRLMKAIHRTKATTLEGFAVKVAAIAFDQADFEVGKPASADVAERELYRLAHDMAKVVKARKKINLRELIDAFDAAKSAYEAAAEGEGPEWDAYEAAEHAVIVYPCQTIEDARLKARFFLDNDGPNDTLRNCFTESGHTLDLFLRSLIGEAAPCD